MNKKNFIVLIATIVGCAVFLGALWFVLKPEQAVDTARRISREVGLREPVLRKEYVPDIREAIAQGDIEKVFEISESVQQKTDTQEKANIESKVIINIELFKQGKRLVAIRNIKGMLERPDVQADPQMRSMLINTLLSFAQMSRLQLVQEEIYSGTLETFRVKDDVIGDDWYASSRALAAESIKHYPTSYAYMQMGRYATDRIIDLRYTYNLTQEQKEALAQQILTWLEIMKNLREREERTGRTGVYVFEDPIQAHRSRMFLLLGVARVYPGDQTYIDLARQELAEVERIAESGRNPNGTYNAVFAENLAQAYDQYMLAIYHMNHKPGSYGMEIDTPAYKEVGAMVDKLTQTVNAEPESFKPFFTYMSEFTRPGARFSRWRKIYVSLGEMFPAHKEMLIKYSGWEDTFKIPFENL